MARDSWLGTFMDGLELPDVQPDGNYTEPLPEPVAPDAEEPAEQEAEDDSTDD